MVRRISPVAVMIQKSQPDLLAAVVGLSADTMAIRAPLAVLNVRPGSGALVTVRLRVGRWCRPLIR